MAWQKDKPANNEKLVDTPALIRANWDAIELLTDSNLQITNAKVAAAAGIVDTKLAQITTASKVSATAITSLPSMPVGAGALPIANGGTNSSSAADARTALGLGTIATQAANAVAITGGALAGTLSSSTVRLSNIATSVITLESRTDDTGKTTGMIWFRSDV